MRLLEAGRRRVRRGACRAFMLVFLLTAAMPAAGGGARAATVSLPDTGAGAGAPAAVPILVDDAGGFLGTDLFIIYDPAVALASSVTATGLSAPQTLSSNVGGAGTVRISLYGTLPLPPGGGALVEIGFTSTGAPGSFTPLTFIWADVNEGAIPVAVEDGSYCVAGTAAPPGQVTVTRAPGSTVAELSWPPHPFATAYNLYRGSLRTLGDLACFQAGFPDAAAVDDGLVPAPGSAFFYLVTAQTCAGESGAGQGTSGAPRVPAAPC